jgi:excinuclease ABC subunit C
LRKQKVKIVSGPGDNLSRQDMAIDAEPAQDERTERLTAQRRGLPDQPGVYLFRDRRGRVIYVGKAKSIRKRVASHFSNPTLYGTRALTDEVDHIESLVVHTEAEALLTEQTFIKQYKPRFNIRLRDDKSYPYIAISLDEDYPRVYFTRERHRRERAYFGPYSSAKRVRGTLDLLGKIFQYRSCEGSEPGRHSGSPCLDYYIKRCGAPCVGYVSKEEYRAGIDGVMAFLSGRFKQIERDLETRMHYHAGEQDYEMAALERNRLQAVRALLERQRVANEGAGTYDAVAVAVEGTEANAQVFQVRDGVLSDRQSFYLDNEGEQDAGIVGEEFILQYYASALSIPSLLVVGQELEEESELDILQQILAERRGGPVEIRAAERGGKRRILDLAGRNARLALDQEKLKSERRRQQRVEALANLQQALGLDTLPVRIECFDISHLGGTHTVASMVVFEGGAAKKSDYRRFTIRGVEDGDDFAAMNQVLSRRFAQWERQNERSPYDAERDASFGALPNLVVIDGGKGQLGAGLEPLQGFRDRGVAVVSLAKRIEEVFLPGNPRPVVMPHDTPELQLMQRVRDEAHRFAITHHRSRRDRAMTASIMDDLPGIGPSRKRALLQHFGSPDAVLGATREELERVPGLPQKVARALYAHLNKTGR